MSSRTCYLLAALIAMAIPGPTGFGEDFQGSTHSLPYEEDPIRYSQQTPQDPVMRLQKRLENGELKLRWDDKFGYLPGVLEALKVPVSSQMLVFSKTSLQRKLISPENPRAVFFNDDVYVAYIPGAPMMEISAADPKIGGTFYTLEQEKVRKPKFHRDSDCIRCHGTARSLGVPGHILRSLGTDATGELEVGTEAEQVNQCTPLSERWGGWYVTGQHGAQTHRGNLIGSEAFARQTSEPNHLGNLASLQQFFETAKYPQPTSDIVALMVLEHQAHMHNYITRLNFETQQMMQTYGHIRYLKNQVNAFLRYLLFTEEVPLSEPVRGNEEFVREFTALGPRDGKGRSLRDLDLKTRMFQHPCSYLLYSEAFDSLPEPMHSHLLERLWKILSGEDQDPQFSKLTTGDRTAILEILRATKPNLPDYWREGGKPVVVTSSASATPGPALADAAP